MKEVAQFFLVSLFFYICQRRFLNGWPDFHIFFLLERSRSADGLISILIGSKWIAECWKELRPYFDISNLTLFQCFFLFTDRLVKKGIQADYYLCMFGREEFKIWVLKSTCPLLDIFVKYALVVFNNHRSNWYVCLPVFMFFFQIL